jgi:ABC-type branched-subunit amino acid transport system ATPase component
MLKVEDYTAGYADKQFLFKDVSFELKPGQVIGVTGLNGSGKSTFLKGLLNFVSYKKGKIILDSDDITNWNPTIIFGKKSIAYLSQRDRVFNHLTVNEHIKLYRAYSKRTGQSTVVSQLEDLLHPHKDALASTLSGGEQLILALLGVSVLNPDYVFLDEPSDSLDVNHKELLLQILSSWQSDKGLLVVEQNTEILKSIAGINLIIDRV